MASKLARTLKVDITSDTVCPFCILGVTQFETAVKKWNSTNPDKPVQVDARLLPYQLRPNMSEEPVDLLQWSAENLGGAERSKRMRAMLSESFKEVGLTLTQNAKITNTNQAHRLEQLALTKGNAINYAVGKELLEDHHLKGLAPNDADNLARVAVENGLFETPEQAKVWIKSDALNAETQREYAKQRAEGISGVPFFVFDDKFATSGAVGVDSFYSIIDKVMA